MNISRNKIIIIISLVFLVCAVLSSLFLFRNLQSRLNPAMPTPTVSYYPTQPLPIPTTTPFVNIIKESSNTGALIVTLPPAETKRINTAFELRKFLPVNTEAFILEYDYDNDLFVVKLTSPHKENKQKFIKWMDDSGYSSIPLDRFKFVNKE